MYNQVRRPAHGVINDILARRMERKKTQGCCTRRPPQGSHVLRPTRRNHQARTQSLAVSPLVQTFPLRVLVYLEQIHVGSSWSLPPWRFIMLSAFVIIRCITCQRDSRNLKARNRRGETCDGELCSLRRRWAKEGTGWQRKACPNA